MRGETSLKLYIPQVTVCWVLLLNDLKVLQQVRTEIYNTKANVSKSSFFYSDELCNSWPVGVIFGLLMGAWGEPEHAQQTVSPKDTCMRLEYNI